MGQLVCEATGQARPILCVILRQGSAKKQRLTGFMAASMLNVWEQVTVIDRDSLYVFRGFITVTTQRQ